MKRLSFFPSSSLPLCASCTKSFLYLCSLPDCWNQASIENCALRSSGMAKKNAAVIFIVKILILDYSGLKLFCEKWISCPMKSNNSQNSSRNSFVHRWNMEKEKDCRTNQDLLTALRASLEGFEPSQTLEMFIVRWSWSDVCFYFFLGCHNIGRNPPWRCRRQRRRWRVRENFQQCKSLQLTKTSIN